MFAETANGDLTPYATQIIGMGHFSSSDACLHDGKSWIGFMFLDKYQGDSCESSNESSQTIKCSEIS